MTEKELLKLRRELKSLNESLKEIEERDGQRTKEELEEMNSIMDQIEELRAQIKTAERAAKAHEDLESTDEEEGEETEEREDASRGRIEVKKPEPYASLGETLQAIARTVRTGKPDARLLRMDEETRAITGLGESIPSDGGFLIGKDTLGRFLENVWDTGVVAAMCDRMQLTGNANGIKLNGFDETSRADGSRYGGVRGYWTDEGASMTAAQPKFRKVSMDLEKLTALYYATDELLQDAAALQNRVNAAVTGELAFKLDDGIINGDGAGKPYGIISANCAIDISAETSQASTTILYENIIKMYARMLPRSLSRAVWLANADILPQLMVMNLAVGTGGGPVWIPPGGASARPYNTLLGRPLYFIEQCQTLGTSGDIIFFDPAHYLIIEKGGIQQAMSIHVRFLNNETVFRFVMRVNGQPDIESAITPFKGSNTIGPILTLATR